MAMTPPASGFRFIPQALSDRGLLLPRHWRSEDGGGETPDHPSQVKPLEQEGRRPSLPRPWSWGTGEETGEMEAGKRTSLLSVGTQT